MQEHTRYAVGLDIGTTTVRCVVGYIDANNATTPNIIGVGSAPNSGMRKGTVVNIVNTAQAIDHALEQAERMSGHQISQAVVNINGSHIVGMSSKGVVAVGTQSHEITEDDLARAEEAATVVQLPANREILQVTPRSYQLDGHDNIKDPLGMSGVRLEVDAHVITALTPHVKNLAKAAEMTQTAVSRMVVSGLAAARAVVTPQQMENGVVIIDLGGTTTNIAVYEEGDLQHIAVLPVGSVNVTNDLAIGLKTDLDIAEEIKLKHTSAVAGNDLPEEVTFTHNGTELHFKTAEVQMIVEARLEEIFEMIDQELKSIGRSAKLPGGAVLVGGGAHMKGIDAFAKDKLHLAARIAKPSNMTGVTDKVATPEYVTAVGLMLLDFETHAQQAPAAGGTSASVPLNNIGQGVGGVVSKLSNVFKKMKP